MAHTDHDEAIQCPGERSPITYAVCKGRQRRHYPRCEGCPVPAKQNGGAPTKADQRKLEVFQTDGILGVYPDQLDEQLARKIGAALSQLIQGKQLVVGNDMRPSSDSLAKAAKAGITSTGVTAVDIGLAATEVFYFTIANYRYDGGLMVTGGQHPREYNGFKASRAGARLLTSETGILNIQTIVERGLASAAAVAGTVRVVDPIVDYRNHILKFARPIRKMRIVVDAGNGMAAKIAPLILERTGCEMVPLYCELDGAFPNRDPNPFNSESLKDLRKTVIERGADLGVAFDGDADCCVFVDEHGGEVAPDLITALIARDILRKDSHATIVYDLCSSRVISEEIRRAGGIPCQVRAGHAHVREAIRKRQAVFAGGPQGHYFYRDNFYSSSPMITLLHVLGMLTAENKTLSQMVMPLRRYYRTGELEIKVGDRDERIRALAAHFTNGKINYLDGVTVEFENWWFNARKSETSSSLALNLEGKTPEIVEKARQSVLEVIQG